MRKQELEREFEYIRRLFFPLWDKKREWKIKVIWHLPSHGLYDDQSKRILLQGIPEKKDALYRLLIHEMSHCASSNHGKKFLERLSKAKLRAKQLGLRTLVEEIKDEINKYTEQNEPYDNSYQMIEDAIWANPDVSWKNLLKWTAKQRGMYPKEFLKKHKRAKKIFLSAKKEAREEREARARFLKNNPERKDVNS